jgi:hypothetical protein
VVGSAGKVRLRLSRRSGVVRLSHSILRPYSTTLMILLAYCSSLTVDSLARMETLL